MKDDPKFNNTPEKPADDQPVVSEDVTSSASDSSTEPEPTEDPATDKVVDEVARSESDAELEAAFAPKPVINKASFRQKYLNHKKWTIPLTVVIVLLLVVFGLPVTRYKVLGLVVKKPYTLTLVDSATHKPVSGATATINNLSVISDGNGKAVFKALPVGPKVVKVSKQYYQAYYGQIFIGLTGAHNATFNLIATGRQVHISVVNKATGKGIAGASITAAGTTAKTDTNGDAHLVLPADKNTTQAQISANGYNNLTATVQITTQEVSANKIQLIPAGHVYFLSNKSGTIDVVSTNYDGSNRQTVLAGTGYENGYATELIPSPGQKYLALITRRTNVTNGDGLYIINTATSKMTKAEELANAGISSVGWDGNYFAYTIQDYSKNSWESGQTVLKSYNTASATSQVLDQTTAEGTGVYDYANQTFTQPISLMDGALVYAKSWTSSYGNTSRLTGKQDSIYTMQPNGSGKKSLRDLNIPGGSSYVTIGVALAGPHTLYFEMPTTSSGDPNQGALYFKYTKGSLTQLNNFTYGDYTNPNLLDGFYGLSPSGNATLYSDSVDGHLVVSVGDANGNNKQKILTLPTDGEIKGWLNDNYVLVTQNTNQLDVVPASPSPGAQALPVSDFYVIPRGHS